MLTKHVDKHGECKSVLASKSGKFLREENELTISHIVSIGNGVGVCHLFTLTVYQSLSDR